MVEDAEPRVHDWRIEPREYERQRSRRGRTHAYEWIDPNSTALVVIDMVPFFVEDNPYGRGIVPNINRLATSLRAAGGTVAWVLPGGDGRFASWTEEFFGPDVAELFRTSGGSGPLPDRLWSGLEHHSDDLMLEKTAASAFFPGRCELASQLGERAIDTVLITGTVTNVCCESSARDASTLGYRVIMAADGNAARRDQEHNATLHTIYRTFGDVRPSVDLLALLDRSMA